MAGFSRAPSAWAFQFDGINTTDAPDQLPATQYPLAVNIRAIGDRHVQTRPGYDLLFVAESAPVIVTTCPLDSGFVDAAYEVELEVTGGIPPYTWTIESGTLPAGVTLNASTGVLSGTPTEFGVFTITIRVTDDVGHFDEVEDCTATILPVEACGSFANIDWAHNARVGPFLGPDVGTVLVIGRVPGDATSLFTWYSTQFGQAGSWLSVSGPTLGDNILSFDCHEHTDGDRIIVATQEAVGSGRVAYHCFSKVTKTWTVLDTEVVASVNIQGGGGGMQGGNVSIVERANGNIGIMYDADIENVGGSDKYRYAYRESDDEGVTWGAEMASGQAGSSTNYAAARVVAYSNGKLRFFSGNDNTPFFGHYYVQTLSALNTWGGITQWFEGGALSQVQQGRMAGDYCTFEDGGVTKVVIPLRTLDELRYAIFVDSDTPSTHTGLGSTCFIGTPDALYPQASARFAGAAVHIMAATFAANVPTWDYHKQASSPYTSYSPSGNADQAGPIFSILGEGIPGQEHASIVATVGGVEYYIGLRDSATAGFGTIFNWIRLDQLPTSASETISVWGAECSS